MRQIEQLGERVESYGIRLYLLPISNSIPATNAKSDCETSVAARLTFGIIHGLEHTWAVRAHSRSLITTILSAYITISLLALTIRIGLMVPFTSARSAPISVLWILEPVHVNAPFHVAYARCCPSYPILVSLLTRIRSFRPASMDVCPCHLKSDFLSVYDSAMGKIDRCLPSPFLGT